jgi:hypothetical protein
MFLFEQPVDFCRPFIVVVMTAYDLLLFSNEPTPLRMPGVSRRKHEGCTCQSPRHRILKFIDDMASERAAVSFPFYSVCALSSAAPSSSAAAEAVAPDTPSSLSSPFLSRAAAGPWARRIADL